MTKNVSEAEICEVALPNGSMAAKHFASGNFWGPQVLPIKNSVLKTTKNPILGA